ncbi:MAG: hypothetical protein NTV51_05520, partial [Verrucomicrobia bacterium]|nr:hypothetical protein [Verrucomicrobiota bacterium]
MPRKTRGVKWLCWLLPVCTALAAETRGRWFTEPVVQTKFGVDSNPQAATGPDANIAGGTDHFTQ